MAKCPKCENENFKIEKRGGTLFCYVVCSECNTVVGVLEDINFKKQLDLIINNECGLDRLINERHQEILNKLNEMEKNNYNLLEDIYLKLKNK
ncbi:putative Zn finger protein [Clostridium pascui]|uniref:hypothetical protein n=1 Tax=Clostridium pascui TaxID=46609 RepID=UPI00195AC77B|nr:hypothetical protein [Clostridium pascui]MBM7869241.1 putative Zn finger protein [Clostridium pascui]